MSNKPQKFWNFSLELYDRQGVAAACLDLQNTYQLDVNLLLFCFWHAKDYGEIDRKLMRDVIAISSQWRANVVQPLRNTRSWMKLNSNSRPQFEDLRERIKEDELMAEKLQQEKISSLAFTFNETLKPAPSKGDAEKNIDSLLLMLGVERDEKIDKSLEIINSAMNAGY